MTTSYAINLRDSIVTRLKAMPYFAAFNFTTNKLLQIQLESLPLCGVYFIQELGSPDGESQTGETRFRTAVRIGFSVMIVYNDGDAAEYELDNAYQALCGLFSDPFFRRDGSTCLVQGFNTESRQHIFGNLGQSNETPIAELRMELMVDLGTITFPTIITDDLNVIHVEVDYPYGRDDVQNVVVEYDLEQNP